MKYLKSWIGWMKNKFDKIKAFSRRIRILQRKLRTDFGERVCGGIECVSRTGTMPYETYQYIDGELTHFVAVLTTQQFYEGCEPVLIPSNQFNPDIHIVIDKTYYNCDDYFSNMSDDAWSIIWDGTYTNDICDS